MLESMAFMQAFLEEQPAAHPVLQPTVIPWGGLSLFFPDWMHSKSLGVDANLLGSCIAYLAREFLPGTQAETIAVIWDGIQREYRSQKFAGRLGRLTMNMVTNAPFPRLSAKAHEIRCLLPVMEILLRGWAPANPIVAWFHRLVALSAQMDNLVFDNKTFVLSPRERRDLRRDVFLFNAVLSRLASNFIQRGEAYCHFTIKNHYLCHLALRASTTGLSPRLGFCYQGEDYMSLIKTLCIGSSRGADGARLIVKANEKYLRGLDLMLMVA